MLRTITIERSLGDFPIDEGVGFLFVGSVIVVTLGIVLGVMFSVQLLVPVAVGAQDQHNETYIAIR